MENLNTERHLNSIWLSPVLTVHIIWIPSHPHSKSMKRRCLIWLNICLDSYYNRTLQIHSKWTIFFTSYLQEHILSPSNYLPNSRSAAEEVCVNQQSSPTSLHIMYIYMHINALCIIYLHFCTNYVQIKPNFKWRHNYTCVWMLFAFCRFMLWMLWRPSVCPRLKFFIFFFFTDNTLFWYTHISFKRYLKFKSCTLTLTLKITIHKTHLCCLKRVLTDSMIMCRLHIL